MKAITVEPRKPGSARFEDVPEPEVREGSVLVEAVAVGVCGTDVEIAEGKYGWAPPGHARLVLGHESLGRVVDPGPSSGLKKGDFVVGIVRRPDPVPCPSCAVGEWDMCRNGQYTERGIKEIHGFMSERWRIEPEYALKLVLRNNVIVGSVNANKRRWYKASQALARADRAWPSRLITRREKPEDFEKALGRTPDDIEVVLQFSEV
jgi:threonine dehydrogenase-like Zn-dependent dehydrogenase